jgi:hypothetical protein
MSVLLGFVAMTEFGDNLTRRLLSMSQLPHRALKADRTESETVQVVNPVQSSHGG